MIVSRDRRSAVLELLRMGPRTEGELSRALAWPRSVVHAACRVLALDGEVETEVGVIVRGRKVLSGEARWKLPGS